VEIRKSLVQYKEKQSGILTTPSQEVNMRLYKENQLYRNTIQSIVRVIRCCLHTEFDDYAELYGMSGANIGIPFKIIAVLTKDTKRGRDIVMINPVVIEHSRKCVEMQSNCGSLNLSESITVNRYCWVMVEYYDTHGKKHTEKFNRNSFGATVQHEIDHTNGILIIDED